jgi:hypothetical protein
VSRKTVLHHCTLLHLHCNCRVLLKKQTDNIHDVHAHRILPPPSPLPLKTNLTAGNLLKFNCTPFADSISGQNLCYSKHYKQCKDRSVISISGVAGFLFINHRPVLLCVDHRALKRTSTHACPRVLSTLRERHTAVSHAHDHSTNTLPIA